MGHGCSSSSFTAGASRSGQHATSRPRSPPPPCPASAFRVEPRALTAAEIDEIIDGYGRAAELAATGGLDGVEISAAHRYLIEQFLDPTLNLRDDEWRDGRRFLTAVLRAVRQGAPSLCVGVRLSADSQRVVGLRRTARKRRASTTSRSRSETRRPTSARSGSHLRRRSPQTRSQTPRRSSRGLYRALPPRASSIQLPAEQLLAAGRAEAVGMTRALIADPDLPAKARSGRLAEARAVRRLQRLYCALPRRNADRVRGQSGHRPRAAAHPHATRDDGAAIRGRGRRAGGDRRSRRGGPGRSRRRTARASGPARRPDRTGRCGSRRREPGSGVSRQRPTAARAGWRRGSTGDAGDGGSGARA